MGYLGRGRADRPLSARPGPREGRGSACWRGRFEERTFSNDVAGPTYKVAVPSGCTGQSLPVVVMLHGCTQNPDDFAARMDGTKRPKSRRSRVAYPRQSQSANMQKCWNWFNAGDQQRQLGEPPLIAGIAAQVVDSFLPTRLNAGMWRASGWRWQRRRSWRPPIPMFSRRSGSIRGFACGAARDMPSAFAAMGGGGTGSAEG